jgi:hypothetical protein
MSVQSPKIEIPAEIQTAADAIPKGIGFSVRPGPTFLEYKKDLRAFIIGMACFALIFIGIGILMMFVEWWFGLIFVLAGILPLILLKKTFKTQLLVFVIDLATEMVYAADQDIEFKAINSIDLLMTSIGGMNSFTIALNYTNNTGEPARTVIMRTWHTEISGWLHLGEYFAQTLSQFLQRPIFFNREPVNMRTGENCLWITKSQNGSSMSWGK